MNRPSPDPLAWRTSPIGGPVEFVEDMRHVGRGEPHAVVRDVDGNPSPFRPGFQPDGRVLQSVLQRIVDEVLEHHVQRFRVGMRVKTGWRLDHDIAATLLEEPAFVALNALERGRDIDLGNARLKRVRLQPTGEQDVGHEPIQPVDLADAEVDIAGAILPGDVQGCEGLQQ